MYLVFVRNQFARTIRHRNCFFLSNHNLYERAKINVSICPLEENEDFKSRKEYFCKFNWKKFRFSTIRRIVCLNPSSLSRKPMYIMYPLIHFNRNPDATLYTRVQNGPLGPMAQSGPIRPEPTRFLSNRVGQVFVEPARPDVSTIF